MDESSFDSLRPEDDGREKKREDERRKEMTGEEKRRGDRVRERRSDGCSARTGSETIQTEEG